MKINKIKLGVAMANNGMNFIELAIASGVSRTTLSYINNGKACRPDIVHKISVALKISIEELIEKD